MRGRTSLLFALVTLAAVHLDASDVERQLRTEFPSLAVDGRSTFDAAEEVAAGRAISGLRARVHYAALRMFYPLTYDAPFVAECGDQRVVLRAVGARVSPAEQSEGKLVYAAVHDSVDVVEIAAGGRSEELLVLQDDRAPTTFDYEIVETRGAAAVVEQDGAILFKSSTRPSPERGRFTTSTPSLQIERPWVVDRRGNHSDAQWSLIERDGRPAMLRLTIAASDADYPIVVDPTFSVAGTMSVARQMHSATLLSNGRLLFAGGFNGSFLSSAEIYDPSTGLIFATGSMLGPRDEHAALALPNGKVLVCGGRSSATTILNTAELYDPLTGKFTATGTLNTARYNPTATLLANGKVLVTGGQDSSGPIASAETYDPGTGQFTPTATNMASPRRSHTATLLPNGKVLIAGGFGISTLATTEYYDPSTNAFSAAATMAGARQYHTATCLPDGRVLVAGGVNANVALSSAEMFDPTAGTTGSFTSAGNMTTARELASATLLPNGTLLLAGGASGNTFQASAEIYYPASSLFAAIGTMATGRWEHTATLLPNGRVAIAGGYNGSALNSVEIFDPVNVIGLQSPSQKMTTPRASFTGVLLSSGKVLLIGGDSTSAAAELFDPVAFTFTATGSLNSPRQNFTATLLPDGRVLVAGGVNGSTPLQTAEIYDPTTGTFSAIKGLGVARWEHTATLLRNGRVLIAGGQTANGPTSVAEFFDASANGFFGAGVMKAARKDHSATLMPNGQVLIAGGCATSATCLSSAEVWDPIGGTFNTVPGMSGPRAQHSATLLPNGRVLLAGGTSGTAYLSSAEIFNPGTSSFTSAGTMSNARLGHIATLLPNGTVLLAYGENSGGPSRDLEIYDPVAGSFQNWGLGFTARSHPAGVLLPDGQVLVAGGVVTTTPTDTVELFIIEDAWPPSRRPVISTATTSICQPGNLALAGSLFTGDSESSSGNSSNSASNAPLIRLRRIDNDQTAFVVPQSFSPGSAFSNTITGFPAGIYRATVVSNALAARDAFLDLETTPLIASYPATQVNLSSSVNVSPRSYPAGYNSLFYPLVVGASNGFAGSLDVDPRLGIVKVSNAGPPGDYTIMVFSQNSCGTASSQFTLQVIGPPTSVSATGGTPQATPVNTGFGVPLQATVKDAAGHPLSNVGVTFSGPAIGATAALSSTSALTNSAGVASITAAANGTLGSYNVTAIVGGLTAAFSLTNSVGVPSDVVATASGSSPVSVTWTPTPGAMYEVERIAAGGTVVSLGTSTNGTFSDGTVAADTAYLYKVRAISPNATPYSAGDLATTVAYTHPTLTSFVVYAADFTELRTAVDAVRALAGLQAWSFADPTLTSGVTTIRAVHLTELRSALDSARSALSLPATPYTNATITAGVTPISAADVLDIRNGVQ